MDYSSHAQTSLNTNRKLREKNRWKFKTSQNEMPQNYRKLDIDYDEKRITEAEKRKFYRTAIEYIFVMILMLSIFTFMIR